MKAWPVLGIFLIQVLLFLAHWFLFRSWTTFWPGLGATAQFNLQVALLVLSFSFVVSALLSFRFSNFAVTFFYKIAAIWLGFLNFIFYGAWLTWLAWYVARAFGAPNRHELLSGIADGFLIFAVITGIYGLLNARIIRVRRIPVRLPNLPESWRGRRAVLMSDLHLGNVNGTGFCRRMTQLAAGLNPDIVFIPGDLFDGTIGNLDRLIAPLKELAAPFGIYFSTGNHEEFRDPANYVRAISRIGIRVLANERVTVDGLHILGIPYSDLSYPIRVKATLDKLSPGAGEASILINHAPIRLPIVEQAGISLQVSGHTHGGQIIPYTWVTRRIFGPFTSGLHRFGELQVYTSTGAGTWGPPMRVGVQPEIVVLEFE